MAGREAATGVGVKALESASWALAKATEDVVDHGGEGVGDSGKGGFFGGHGHVEAGAGEQGLDVAVEGVA